MENTGEFGVTHRWNSDDKAAIRSGLEVKEPRSYIVNIFWLKKSLLNLTVQLIMPEIQDG